jgi:uncharacterized membrane protein YcaP (DUF421 family)
MSDGLVLFGASHSITWQQECARAVVIFAYGLAAIRLAGRRLFGKWAALDIIVSIVIGSNLSRALTGNAPLWGTLAGTSLLLFLHWGLARAATLSPMVSKLFEGGPIVLARNGMPSADTLRSENVSAVDIGEALRQAGLHEQDEAEIITLEPSGKITILKRAT